LNYFSYFSEIEETFVRRRRKNLLLSPLDWALIESWKERGVPLHIVLRALNEVFDNAEKQPARKRSIKSLLYCRDEVENQFAAWSETQTGREESPKSKVQSPKSEEFEIPREKVISHLHAVSRSLQKPRVELNGSWASFSGEILSDLQTAKQFFETNGGLENLENILNELDQRVDEKLPQIVTPEIIAKVKSETAAQLRSHKNKMTEAVYAQTFQTLLIKNLRESINLPRFSLVYL
jgi:hypothetical protein